MRRIKTRALLSFLQQSLNEREAKFKTKYQGVILPLNAISGIQTDKQECIGDYHCCIYSVTLDMIDLVKNQFSESLFEKAMTFDIQWLFEYWSNSSKSSEPTLLTSVLIVVIDMMRKKWIDTPW